MSIISFISIDFNILLSWHPPAVQACDEQFYAIYYTTEFKFIGRGDAFIAPTDGTYTFKLWGSPGGVPANYNRTVFDRDRNQGGYVQVDVPLKRNQKIYVFVGSAGNNLSGGIADGGYNGGGMTITCPYGAHSASGGGATHISWSNNPIIADRLGRSGSISCGGGWYLTYTHSWSNPNNTIAIAGGGGGDGSYDPDGASYAVYSWGGGNISAPCAAGNTVLQYNISANNNTNTGYTKGAGQFGICDSGGGAGWYSGYSQYRSKISAGHIWTYDPYGGCFGTGGGGTSYIRSDYTGFQIAGNDSRIFNVYKNPYTEGRNGYIKVTKK